MSLERGTIAIGAIALVIVAIGAREWVKTALAEIEADKNGGRSPASRFEVEDQAGLESEMNNKEELAKAQIGIGISNLVANEWEVTEINQDGTVVIELNNARFTCGMINDSEKGVYDPTLPPHNTAWDVWQQIGRSSPGESVVIWDDNIQNWKDGDPRFMQMYRGYWVCPWAVWID